MPEFSWPSELTAEAFFDAGWTVGRKVDASQYFGSLDEQGFYISPEAVTIMESFGGLDIVPPYFSDATWAADPIEFEPEDYFDGMRSSYEKLERRLGQRVTPLASSAGLMGILLVEDGHLIGDQPRGIVLFGDSFTEGMDLIVRRPHRPRLILEH